MSRMSNEYLFRNLMFIQMSRRLVAVLLHLLLLMSLTGCYRSPHPSRFQWKVSQDTLIVADTLTRVQQDSLAFAQKHHFSQGFNFVVRGDSLTLLKQQPEEHVNGLSTDSFAIRHGQRLVVLDIRIIPDDQEDSVWIQIASENYDIGWVHEGRLLNHVDPDDPISQFISIFSDVHLLIFLVVISLIGVGYLLRMFLRRRALIVHFHDIDSFYPALLAIIVAASATLYASIQNFAPEMWREFYFHPTLNPFSQPLLLSIFLCSVWAMLIVGLAAIDDVHHRLPLSDALLYLCGLAAVCAFNYVIFTISTLYYVGYLLLVLYVVYAIHAYKRLRSTYVCGHCGHKLRRKGRCPLCGTMNE